ncbi:MAG: tRNA (adenosine(37)-N6)-dimethylallyltransferase MiaA [Cyclobacteriaceae bacterium]|nr:tRNA (adenosine(37)-N6)-dimethylallyltransferase MiaA [Cyclobacteriaceae bacterium]
MEINKKHLVVVVGPTAVGKTALTVQLAEHFGVSVLNADSRQVFKELFVGTAKPTLEELQGVPHYFVNDRSITDEFSAGHFEKEGLAVLDVIFEKENIAILSGGSGLYIDALCYGFSEIPKVDASIRLALKAKEQVEGVEPLYKELQRLDPEYAKTINPENQQRIIRALEICIGTGKPFSYFRTGAQAQRNFELHFIGLELPRDILYERINVRMDAMIAAGLFEEAKANEPFKATNALQTVGYSEIFSYFEGKYDKEEAIRLLKRNSRRYAKRQMTWFKKNELVQWFEPTQLNKIIDYLTPLIKN